MEVTLDRCVRVKVNLDRCTIPVEQPAGNLRQRGLRPQHVAESNTKNGSRMKVINPGQSEVISQGSISRVKDNSNNRLAPVNQPVSNLLQGVSANILCFLATHGQAQSSRVNI